MILDLLENGDPSRIAISVAGGGSAVTYDQLRQQVDALAANLSRLGLGRGDRIAMALPNGLEVIASFLAASTVGTAAPLNPAYTRDEFKFYLADTGARALILPPKEADEARAAAGADVLVIEADLDRDGRVQHSRLTLGSLALGSLIFGLLIIFVGEDHVSVNWQCCCKLISNGPIVSRGFSVAPIRIA